LSALRASAVDSAYQAFEHQALRNGMEQIFCVCERGDVLLKSMKGFIRVRMRCTCTPSLLLTTSWWLASLYL